MLSDSEDEQKNEELHKITINEYYAKAFQYRKEREELDKLKDKLGSDVSESDLEEEETDSESAESEDEDGEELTPAVDAAILRTLARIRQKDPSIYESGKNIFDEEQEKLAAKAVFTASGGSKKKELVKPVTIRQAALEAQLTLSRSPSPEPLTHVQEQAALRKETISAFNFPADGGEDDEDDLLIPREKTKDEQEQEEEEYRAFLEREVGNLKEIIGVENDAINTFTARAGDGEGNAKKKKKKKTKEHDGQKLKEEEDQEFLMNYILNRGWIDKSKDRIPTYKEITNKSGKSKASKPGPDSGSSSNDDLGDEDEGNHSDSSFDSLNDAFETSYNFRFEEPGGSTIPSFPRSIPTLVRREDPRRKEARERRKQRKEEEMEKKREEVRRLKALKMREIKRKLETIGREGGLLSSNLKGKGKGKSVRWEDDDAEGEMHDTLAVLDLEGDWDPEKHDQQMAGLYGSKGDEGDWEDVGEVDEDGKPVWEDDIDIGDIHMDHEEDIMPVSSKKDKKKKKKNKKKDGADEDVGVDIDAMDADVLALRKDLGEEEEWDGTEEMRKRKLDEYMEEIYNLDFNDMVGDLPTRFRYMPVAPQTYSLTPVEILLATNKELNEFMSIKRYAPYKNDARKWDAKRHQKLKELKETLAERSRNGGWLVKNPHSANTDAGTNGSGRSGEGEQKSKKRKGKKERLRARAAAGAEENDTDDGIGTNVGADGRNGEMGTNDSEAKSLGDYAGSKNKKPQSLMNLDGEKELKKPKEKDHKRKRDDEEFHQSQRQRQDKGNEKDDGSGRPKKKRRRKHNEGGEVAQVE